MESNEKKTWIGEHEDLVTSDENHPDWTEYCVHRKMSEGSKKVSRFVWGKNRSLWSEGCGE